MVCAAMRGAKQEVAISIPARRIFFVVIMAPFFHGRRANCNFHAGENESGGNSSGG
jgi:hypothetical protein